MMAAGVLLYLFVGVGVGVLGAGTVPEQIHIAFTGQASSMMIEWVTMEDTATSTVMYGQDPSTIIQKATGSSTHYYFPFRSPALHTVTLENLEAGKTYHYKVGDDAGGYSPLFQFQSEPSTPVSESDTVRVAILADNGNCDNSRMVLEAIEKEDQKSPFDFLILSGDLSYANGEQSLWDKWGNEIQPSASHFPFMVAPGNHEALSLFIAYNYRFNMPNNGYDSLYYSYDYRNVHVLVLNSESLNEYHWSSMYKFAQSDLESVNKEKTPWIFAAFHHPWYCSNDKHNNSATFMKDEYEDLFFKHGVSVVLQGHVHAYERTYPVYHEQLTQGAPVYMLDGHGGNHEGLYDHWWKQPVWSAYREAEYGFSTMEIFNSTHLHWQMIRANDSAIRDDAWIIRS